LLVEIVVTYVILQRNDRVLLALIIFNVSFTPLGILILLSDLVFRAKVSDKKIKVRTYFGRKYEFKMSDISLIECDRSDSMESGTHFYIIVKTQKETLNLTGTMIGFDKMSEYLLNKLNTGEIDPNAISCECQETLIQYKNKAYIPKKGR